MEFQVIVGVNPWVAHFSKAVFGHDSDQFRPERWLQPKEMLSDMEKYYIPVSPRAERLEAMRSLG